MTGGSHKQDSAIDDQSTQTSRGSISQSPDPPQTNATAQTAATDPQSIAAREEQRDSSLQAADQCASQHAWACVQQQASEALAIDAGSVRAQSLMERAILMTGWAPLKSSPGLPNPNAPSVTDRAAQAAAVERLPRGTSTIPLPSSLDWDAPGRASSKDRISSATPPPLPGATSAPNAPANANPTTPDSANATATAAADAANEPAAVDTPIPSGNDNSTDAQERAIVQSGWKHPAPPDAAH